MSQDREIAQGLAWVMHAFLSRKATSGVLATRLRRLAALVDGSADASSKPPKASDPRVQEVFEFWRRTTDHPRAKLTRERRAKVEARLREGYSVAELKAAIRHVASDPFHQGENDRGKKYDDLLTALRTGSRVEGYREQASEAAPDASIEAEIARLQGETS